MFLEAINQATFLTGSMQGSSCLAVKPCLGLILADFPGRLQINSQHLL